MGGNHVPGSSEDVDPIGRDQSQGPQTGPTGVHSLFVLDERLPRVAAHLVEGPVLGDLALLAIHNLLHLLLLDMGLDELSAAHALRVSVLLGTINDDVVERLDLGIRGGLEAIDGARVTARDTLTRLLLGAGYLKGVRRLLGGDGMERLLRLGHDG